MSEQATEAKEWSVDWEVKVLVSLTKTVTLGASQIIEAGSAEEAVQQVKDELESGADASDIDFSIEIKDEDFEIDSVEMDTFKLLGQVTPWEM